MAVPFLTQSGLDRGILRTIWTVADPNNVGTLTSTDQFHLMLRLVAMAQSGLLGFGSNTLLSADSLRMQVLQSSAQLLPLPTFSSVVIPPQDQLMGMFGPSLPTHPAAASILTTTTTTTIDEAFGSLVGEIQNAPLRGVAVATTGLEPAGGGVGGGQHVPSYGANQIINNNNDYGNMMMTALPPSSLATTTVIAPGMVTQHVSRPSNASALSDTSFTGDFGDGSVQQPLPPQQHHRQMSSMGSMSADAFSTMSVYDAPNIADVPLPANSGIFATTAGVPPGPIFGMAGSSSVVSISSNCSNQLQMQQQPQLPPSSMVYPQQPSLPVGIDGPEKAPTQPLVEQEDEVADDDDFGGFASATTTDISFSVPPPAPFGMSTVGLGPSTGQYPNLGFGSTVTTTDGINNIISTTDISDAFSSLDAIVPDAPLPSLDAFAAVVAATSTDLPTLGEIDTPAAAPDNDVKDDDFTGFEEAPAPLDTAAVTATSSNNDEDYENEDDEEFGDFGSATQPSMESTQQSLFGGESQQPIDPFSFQDQSQPPQPLPPYMTDTGRAMSEPVTTSSGSSALGVVAVTDSGRSLSVSDAFDAFGEILPRQDDPLPTLDVFGGGIAAAVGIDSATFGDATNEMNTTLPHEAGNGTGDDDVDDDDDFGGFSSAPALSSEALPQEASEFQPFGSNASPEKAIPAVTDMGRSLSEPVTSSWQPLPTALTDIGRSVSAAFGDLPATQEDGVLASFDFFGGTTATDATVPASLAEATTGEFDEFGSFASPSDIATTQDKDSMAFETSISPPSMADLGRTRSEPFAGSAPFPAVTDVRSLSISDAFGDIPSLDTPLPSLDILSETIAVTEVTEEGNGGDGGDDDDDDFGDFGGFVEAASPTEVAPATEANQSATSYVAPRGEPDFLAFDSTNDAEQNPATTSMGLMVEEELSTMPVDFDAESRPLPISDMDGQGQHLTSDDSNFFGSGNQMPQSVTSIGRTSSEPFSSLSQPPAVADSTRSTSLATDAFSLGPTPGSRDPGTWDAFVQPEPSPPEADEADMEFGDFSSAGFDAPAQTSEPDTLVSGSPPDTSFAAFDSAPALTDGSGVEDDDMFGDFGAASQAGEDAEPSAAVESAVKTEGSEQAPPDDTVAVVAEDDDDFGDFQEIAPTGNGTMQQGAEPDLFAGFDAPTQSQNRDDPFAGGVDVTQTTASSENPPPSEQEQAKEVDPSDLDGFGDFSSFEPADTATSMGLSDPMTTTQGNDFDDNDDDDWGDFEDVQGPGPVLSASSSGTDAFAEEVQLRDRIRSLSLRLPESVLLKSGLSGEHADLGDAFEANIGIKSTMDGASKRRVDRCVQVLELLSGGGDHSRLASTYWVQVFDVANEELDLALTLLNEAREVPPHVWESDGNGTGRAVVGALTAFLAGLAECMRVVRSIVATVGDVLLLDESAMLTIDTWASSWCSLSILEKALEAERKWRDIQRALVPPAPPSSNAAPPAWPHLPAAPPAVSLQEIRSRTNGDVGRVSNKICQLTLQPLWEQEDGGTTRAEVTWQGRPFMACSANFLANRCPFFVVVAGD